MHPDPAAGGSRASGSPVVGTRPPGGSGLRAQPGTGTCRPGQAWLVELRSRAAEARHLLRSPSARTPPHAGPTAMALASDVSGHLAATAFELGLEDPIAWHLLALRDRLDGHLLLADALQEAGVGPARVTAALDRAFSELVAGLAGLPPAA